MDFCPVSNTVGLVGFPAFGDPVAMDAYGPSEHAGEIIMVGVPCGLGGGHQGTAHGPNAARAAGLFEKISVLTAARDLGDLPLPEGSDRNELINTWLERLRPITREVVLAGAMPLVLGGDHSIAAGSMSGACAGLQARGQARPGLLWIDAHVDLNTHLTTPSGNPHGMPAAALLGWEVDGFSRVVGNDGLFDRSRTAYVGARDIDAGEQRHLDESGIALWSSHDVREQGVEAVMAQALATVSPNREPFCLSFDIDVVDPGFAPGVDTAVPDGLSPAEAMECMARAGDHARIVSLDLVELNPENDVDGQTARIAVDCINATIAAMLQTGRGTEHTDRD